MVTSVDFVINFCVKRSEIIACKNIINAEIHSAFMIRQTHTVSRAGISVIKMRGHSTMHIGNRIVVEVTAADDILACTVFNKCVDCICLNCSYLIGCSEFIFQ